MTEKKEIDQLLEIYKKRVDLQQRFPEVQYGNYQRIINWASYISNGNWDDVESVLLKKHALWYKQNYKEISMLEAVKGIKQLEILLEIFQIRNDLMSSMYFNDLQSMINWAAGVSNKRWEDKDFRKLAQYAEWYTAHETVNQIPIVKQIKDEIRNKEFMKRNSNVISICENSQIKDVCELLYFLILEKSLKNNLEIVETSNIESTITMREAVSKNFGYVWSMRENKNQEIERCGELNLNDFGTNLYGTKKDLAKKWTNKVDHLFILSSKNENENILNELILYEPFVKLGGYITITDVNSSISVLSGVQEFMKYSKSIYQTYFLESNNFVIIKKNET